MDLSPLVALRALRKITLKTVDLDAEQVVPLCSMHWLEEVDCDGITPAATRRLLAPPPEPALQCRQFNLPDAIENDLRVLVAARLPRLEGFIVCTSMEDFSFLGRMPHLRSLGVTAHDP